VEKAREIIDPDYTYWCDRGDSTREEHMEFLAGPDQAIAGWVASIYRDIRAEELAHALPERSPNERTINPDRCNDADQNHVQLLPRFSGRHHARGVC